MPGDSGQKISIQSAVSIHHELRVTFLGAVSSRIKTPLEMELSIAADIAKITKLMQQGARLNLADFPRKHLRERLAKNSLRKGAHALHRLLDNCVAVGKYNNSCHVFDWLLKEDFKTLELFSDLAYSTLPPNELALVVNKCVEIFSNNSNNGITRSKQLLNFLADKQLLTSILPINISTPPAKKTLRESLTALKLENVIETALETSMELALKRAADKSLAETQSKPKAVVKPQPTSVAIIHVCLVTAEHKKTSSTRRSSIVGGDGKLVGTVQKAEAKSVVASSPNSSALKYLATNSLVGKQVLAGIAGPRPTHRRDISSFGEPTPIQLIRAEMFQSYKQKLPPIPVVQSRIPTNSKR